MHYIMQEVRKWADSPLLQIFWKMKMTKQYKSCLVFNNWDTTFIVHFPQLTVLTKMSVTCICSNTVLGSQFKKKKKSQDKRNYNEYV